MGLCNLSTHHFWTEPKVVADIGEDDDVKATEDVGDLAWWQSRSIAAVGAINNNTE